MLTYDHLLCRFVLCRNAPYRSEPEREQAMAPVIEDTIIAILQKLADDERAAAPQPTAGR
jgi:hypothetical protein